MKRLNNKSTQKRTAKGKPQLEELIKKLDGLSEKKLNFVAGFINDLIKNFASDEDYHMEINGKKRPVE